MTRYGLILAVFLLGALRVQAGAKDYFTEFEKDFGPTPRGPVLTHYFAIKNTSKNALKLGTARVSCGCVSASVLKTDLEPGESTVVVAQMDTKRIPVSNVVKSVIVYVPFLAPRLEEVTLRVQSIARDDLFYSPYELSDNKVIMGKSRTLTTKVTLLNQGKWEISDVSSTGKFVTAKTKLLSRQANEVTYEVTATLDEQCPPGYWTSELFLSTNASGLEKLRIPVTVNVKSAIAATPDAVTISDLKTGTSRETKLTLKGISDFKILEVRGGDDIVGVTAKSDEAQSLHTLLFTVKPSKPGDLKRDIIVLTDHKEMPKITIPFEAHVSK